MNLRQNQKGFTIVELLIVVVVIAILAAISIVAYTGITNRANRSAAMEAANAVKSVATTFSGANGRMPTSKAEFVSGYATGGDVNNAIAKLPSDITFKTGALVAADPPKTVQVLQHPATGTPEGFTIRYWDYAPTSGSPRALEMTVGDTSTTAATTGMAN